MVNTLILATLNNDKVSELKQIIKASNYDIDVYGLKDFNITESVIEDGNSLEANSYKKALGYKNILLKKGIKDFYILADDSGLFVDALGGQPGVYSNRYAGDECDSQKNREKLLKEMKGVVNRTACFKCVITLLTESEVYTFYGETSGYILHECIGFNGFGYDSVFYSDELNQSFGLSTAKEKNSVSHRYKATISMIKKLKELKKEEEALYEINHIFKNKKFKLDFRLIGGMSNYTYVISDSENNMYTLRLPGENSELFVNRYNENLNSNLFNKLNVGNDVLYVNNKTGVKVSKYVNGVVLSNIVTSNGEIPYKKVSELLHKIHDSNLKSDNDYAAFNRLEIYQSYLKNFKFPKRYFDIKNEFLKYKEYLESIKQVLCHNDSQPSNFIMTGENIIIVDYEFVGNNDPIYDIACFSNMKMENGLTLLKYYFKDFNNEYLLRFYLWRLYQDLQWYNVAMYKELNGLSKSLKIDFMKVANNYLSEAEAMLAKVNSLKPDEIIKK